MQSNSYKIFFYGCFFFRSIFVIKRDFQHERFLLKHTDSGSKKKAKITFNHLKIIKFRNTIDNRHSYIPGAALLTCSQYDMTRKSDSKLRPTAISLTLLNRFINIWIPLVTIWWKDVKNSLRSNKMFHLKTIKTITYYINYVVIWNILWCLKFKQNVFVCFLISTVFFVFKALGSNFLWKLYKYLVSSNIRPKAELLLGQWHLINKTM